MKESPPPPPHFQNTCNLQVGPYTDPKNLREPCSILGTLKLGAPTKLGARGKLPTLLPPLGGPASSPYSSFSSSFLFSLSSPSPRPPFPPHIFSFSSSFKFSSFLPPFSPPLSLSHPSLSSACSMLLLLRFLLDRLSKPTWAKMEESQP